MENNSIHPLVRAFHDRLVPWEHPVGGILLRGWHSEFSGKPILHFLHGNGFSALTYAPFLKYFMEEFDLVLTQAQGHGGSSAGEAFHGWNENAGYVLDAWQSLPERPANVPCIAMGHSFGGVVSALMCARETAGFHGLVMLDPVLFLPAMIGAMAFTERLGLGPINKLAKITLKRQSVWPSREEAYARLAGKGIFRHWTDEAVQCYVSDAMEVDESGQVVLRCPPFIEAGIFGSYPRKLWRSVRQIKVPVAMFHGEKTYPFVQRASIKLKKCLPRTRVARLPGGHCFMLESPEQSAQAVRATLLEMLRYHSPVLGMLAHGSSGGRGSPA